MTNNESLRLCGGTFFTLLLEARKQLLGANEHYAGKKDGLTEYETLIGLARVIRSDLATPMPTEIKTIQGNASEYKKCKNAGGGYFPFSDKTALRVFDERVKSEYKDTLKKMCSFVESFIDAGGDIKKDELLVKALVELISLDNCIDESQSFYVKEDGATMQKKDVVAMKEIFLQPFLLGVFHYAVCKIDNTVGAETLDAWCPSTGGGKRAYTGDIGVNWPFDIKLSYIELEDDDVSDPGALQTQTPNTTFNLPGNNNTLVAHTDAVNNTYRVMMVSGAPPMPGNPNAAHTITLNTDFYNLLVVGDDELGGQAKAMVITASRQGAVKYRQAFEEYITKKGYDGIHALVAFSGKVKLPDDDKEYTEASINGFPEDRLTKEFDTDNYQVLLVANKYQTGFDQPKLCAMYVLKKLKGVNAVQTL